MKYIAILRDSFREALDSKVLYVTFGLSGLMVLFVASLGLFKFIGTELFPQTDAGQFMIRLRAPSGLRR